MAQAKHTFVESKMNKDLDDRLLSGGQYRNAVNIGVSKSEESDVGALENVLGNYKISDLFPANIIPSPSTEVIGWYISDVNDKIFFFLTNFCDTSADNLSNFAFVDSAHYIIEYDLKTSTSFVLIEGNFLNFSTTHRILGINLIENLLFWTDDRNQPRKINVNTAQQHSTQNIPYYTTEDQISVAKYYPYNPINVFNSVTLTDDIYWDNSTWNGMETTTITRDGGSAFGSDINLYDQFYIAPGSQTVPAPVPGITMQIADIVNSDQELIVWPRVGSTNPSGSALPSTLKLFHSTATNTTDEYLPPTARIKIINDTGSTRLIPAGHFWNCYLDVFAVQIIWETPQQNVQSYDQALSCEVFGDIVIAAPHPLCNNPTFGKDAKVFSNLYNSALSNKICFDIQGSTVFAPDDFAVEQETWLPTGEYYLDICLPNNYYNVDWAGDKDNLKDKFVRFAYRFKFDDDEYSLISPFTQPVFIPKQDGYFINRTADFNDSREVPIVDQPMQAGEVTIVDWFENQIKEVGLNLDLEYPVNELFDKLKVKEVDILYKESDGLTIKVIDSIDFTSANSEVSSNTTNRFTYTYQSGKPYKTLPETEISRTSDRVPLRAQSQETAGNRIIYGNFIDKHTSPLTLDYLVTAGPKFDLTDQGTNYSYTAYPNHTLKQNRTYQVGFVLADRYGRQSDVILAPPREELELVGGIEYGDSTIYNAYKSDDFYEDVLDWAGDSIKILLNSAIPNTIPNREGYPGLYSVDNPLGWYSYKVVVKQKEQDYYNVYLPSLLYGTPLPLAINSDWGTGACSPISASIPVNSNIMAGLDHTTGILPGYKFSLLDMNGDTNEYTVAQVIDQTSIRFTPTNAYAINAWFDNVTYPTCQAPGIPPDYPQIRQAVTFYPGGTLNIISTTVENPDTMTTTLVTDNINKLPPDLNEIRPNQLQYKTSEDQVFPRIARQSLNSWNSYSGIFVEGFTLDFSSQVNTEERSDNVKILGNWVDLFPGGAEQSGLYKQNTNPATITFSNTFQLGSESFASTQRFALFETQPTISNLDIFWESSTGGLISDLNDAIQDSQSAVALGGMSTFQHLENQPATLASPAYVGEVVVLNNQGQVVPVTSMSIHSCVDGIGVIHTNNYIVQSTITAAWDIEATENFVFVEQNSRNMRYFIFEVVDSNNITTYLPYNVQVGNVAPVIQGDALGGIPNNPVESFGMNTGMPIEQNAIGEVSGITNIDTRLYSTNGSVWDVFPTGLANQYSELSMQLVVRESQNGPTVPATGIHPTYQTPIMDGFYLVPPGSPSNPWSGFSGTLALNTYNIPVGAPSWRIEWNYAALPNGAAFANPSPMPYPADFLVGGERWLSIIVKDCNGNNGTLSTEIGSSIAQQDEIKITFYDGGPPTTPGKIECFQGPCSFIPPIYQTLIVSSTDSNPLTWATNQYCNSCNIQWTLCVHN